MTIDPAPAGGGRLPRPDLPRPDLPPGLLVVHRWVLDHWPHTTRVRGAAILVVGGALFATVGAGARIVGIVVDLGLFAYIGLMVVCWIGAGGALVPIPGVRPLSWFLIVQQSTVLNPVAVAVLGALAMTLGQTSFFVASRLEHRHRSEGVDTDGADDPVSPTPAGRRQRLMARSRTLLERGEAMVARRMAVHPLRIVFLVCVVPSPLTTFTTVSAAEFVRFSRFFLASLAGFCTLTTVLVLAGQGLLVALGID